MERNKTYNLKVTRPLPSLWQDKTVFSAPTYADAVEVAHAAWRKNRTSVVLSDGENGIYAWHRIGSDGVATDRNFNSGVPAVQQIA